MLTHVKLTVIVNNLNLRGGIDADSKAIFAFIEAEREPETLFLFRKYISQDAEWYRKISIIRPKSQGDNIVDSEILICKKKGKKRGWQL
jgi:hypothetical protein